MQSALASHRGYDWGALTLARQFAARFDAPLVYATVTRLLADLNRSPGHRHLFSEATRSLSLQAQARILQRYHRPYRKEVEQAVLDASSKGFRIVHISCHSFTPVLHGEIRNADLGLLYDPTRPGELKLAQHWQEALKMAAPDWRVRRNYPYLGKNDGLTTSLRRQFSKRRYVGMELEVNQAIISGPPEVWRALRSTLMESFASALRSV